jgi:hypothetical protein
LFVIADAACIRVGFVYAMNMKYSWGRVKQVSAMMECYDLQCRHVEGMYMKVAIQHYSALIMKWWAAGNDIAL